MDLGINGLKITGFHRVFGGPNEATEPSSPSSPGSLPVELVTGPGGVDEQSRRPSTDQVDPGSLTDPNSQCMVGLWQLKHFLFSPLLGEDSHFDSYFFRWVETTNQMVYVIYLPIHENPINYPNVGK